MPRDRARMNQTQVDRLHWLANALCVMEGSPVYANRRTNDNILMKVYEDISHADILRVEKIWILRGQTCQRN